MKIIFTLKYKDGRVFKKKTVEIDPTTTGEYDDVRDLFELKVGQTIVAEFEVGPCADAVVKQKWVTPSQTVKGAASYIEYELEFAPYKIGDVLFNDL